MHLQWTLGLGKHLATSHRKCCTRYVCKFGQLSGGHRAGKGPFSFQSQRRAMPKNVQTTVQMRSFHMLLRVCSNTLQARCQQYVNQEPPDAQAGFWRGGGTRDQIANTGWIIERAREFQKSIYFFLIDCAKAFDCVDHNKLENSSRDRNTRPSYLPPEKSVCRSKSNMDMEQQTGSKSGKE